MHRLVPEYLLVLLVACLSGCRTVPPQEAVHPFPADRGPVLVIGPLSAAAAAVEGGADLGRYLHQELSARTNGRAIYVQEMPELRHLATAQTLVHGGDLVLGEVGALGRAAQCASAVACLLFAVKPYAPQAVTMLVVWVDADKGAALGRCHLECDLRDPQTVHEFARFLGQGPSRAWPWQSERASDAVRAACMNPSIVQRFAANRAIDALLAPPPGTEASGRTLR